MSNAKATETWQEAHARIGCVHPEGATRCNWCGYVATALSWEEWAKCEEIERSGHDPLDSGYLILTNLEKAAAWLNAKRSDADPGKVTRGMIDRLDWAMDVGRDTGDHLTPRHDERGQFVGFHTVATALQPVRDALARLLPPGRPPSDRP